MKWLDRIPIAIVILFCACIGSVLLNFLFTMIPLRSNFCSIDNSVYQSLKVLTASEWYSRASIMPAEVLRTDTRIYLAEVHWSNDTPNLVYFSIGTERDSLSGSEGFLYILPGQVIPQYWFENYWITYLSQDIYCYKIRGF